MSQNRPIFTSQSNIIEMIFSTKLLPGEYGLVDVFEDEIATQRVEKLFRTNLHMSTVPAVKTECEDCRQASPI